MTPLQLEHAVIAGVIRHLHRSTEPFAWPGLLRCSDFTRPHCRQIWAAMLWLHATGGPVDECGIAATFRDRWRWEVLMFDITASVPDHGRLSWVTPVLDAAAEILIAKTQRSVEDARAALAPLRAVR